jgi:hypothetical protein
MLDREETMVTPITQSEFEGIRPYHNQVGRRTVENAAIDALLPMTGYTLVDGVLGGRLL